jgi:hypothetical protein
MKSDTFLMLAGGAALLYYLWQQQKPQATPLSIYPSLAWTAQTSMAMTPKQKAAAAQAAAIPPTALYSAAQQKNVAAMTTQCVGSYPGCTPLMSDTQLGF